MSGPGLFVFSFKSVFDKLIQRRTELPFDEAVTQRRHLVIGLFSSGCGLCFQLISHVKF